MHVDSSPKNYSTKTALSTTNFSFSMTNSRSIRLCLPSRDYPSMQGHGSSTYSPPTWGQLPPLPTFCYGIMTTSAERGAGQIEAHSSACGRNSTGESGMLMARERYLLTGIWILTTGRCSRSLSAFIMRDYKRTYPQSVSRRS